MTFEKHLRSVSRAASQRLGILWNSWRVFHDRSLLERCFRGFVLPVLEYCPAVWCSAADTHLKLLDCAISGARFLTGGVFECDIAHRRAVAVLCMLYKIRCNPMHSLNDSLPGLYVPVRVMCANARGTGRMCHDGRTSVHLCTASLQNLTVPQDFCLPLSLFCLQLFSLTLLVLYRLVVWGWGLRTDMASISLSRLCIADLF